MKTAGHPAAAAGLRIAIAGAGRRVRIDEVAVYRGDEAEADRRSGIADRRDDLLVARPFHVRAADADDEVTDANTGRLSTSQTRQRCNSNTDIAVRNTPHRYWNSRAIWDHTVLPATRQR